MNNTPISLDWTLVKRDSLAEALAKGERPIGASSFLPVLSRSEDIAVGTSRPLAASDSGCLALIVLPEQPREVLAWITTYAEEAFPISQHCRVITVQDWDELGTALSTPRVLSRISQLWPSLVAGEMLGQVGFDGAPIAIPASRAAACLSFAFARTVLLYPGIDVAAMACIERLAKAENEQRFARRHLTTSILKKIWASALAIEKTPSMAGHMEERLLQVVSGLNPQAFKILQSIEGLQSESAEGRVIAFDKVVDSMALLPSHDISIRGNRALVLAAACILAGKGTSHVGLLAGPARDLPEALVYFGLLAGLIGPRYWDKAWAQQSRGVERMLRQFFRADEPVQADLCWCEFDWLANTYSAPEVFLQLHRSNAGGLAIELLPGVVCQFKLQDQSTPSRSGNQNRLRDPDTSEPRLHLPPDVVFKARGLLAQLQELLGAQGSPPASQQSLFEDSQREKTSRNRGKSSKRSG